MNLSPISLYPCWLCSIDPNNLYRISWLALIDQIVINNQINIDRGFSFGNLVRSFLKLNILLISISRQIVNHLKTMLTPTVITSLWLINSSSFQRSQLTLLTSRSRTPKENFFRLRNDLRTPNKNSFKTYHSINLLRSQVSHLMSIFQVDNSHSDNLIKIISLMSTKDVFHENLIDYLIKE
jgi:hypothetical protein